MTRLIGLAAVATALSLAGPAAAQFHPSKESLSNL